MKECPNCKVIRENNDRYCECGYDLRLNILDDNKINYPVSPTKFIEIILINLFFSVLGVCLTPYILFGFTGFMLDKATLASKAIASLIIVIFLVFLVISNYLIIRRVASKGKIYLALIGLSTFLLFFALLSYACFKSLSS